MKIGLNATCFNDRPSGARQRFIGIYSELIKRLPNAEFVVYEPVDCRVGGWFDGAPNVSTRCTPIPSSGRAQKFISGLRYWGSALANEGFDIFEQFNIPLVKAPTGRVLLTIHDIRESQSNALKRAVYKSVVGKSLRMADHVVTVSEAMKEEILAIFPDISISVIYNGLDAHSFDRVSESDQLALRQKFSLPEEFILSVGHIERRKNYLRLVEAIALLRDRGCLCFLVIIGNDSGERNAIEERIESLNLSGHVKILSGLSDLEVHCAYKLSSLFVFPSTYEGFGIPILETMAASRTMVLSDMPVFREITQDKGVYFDPRDIESMVHAIENVLTLSCERVRLIEYGKKRVQDFSFHKLAAQLESLYRSLM